MERPNEGSAAYQRSTAVPTHAIHWYDFWTGQPVIGGQTISAPAPYEHIPLYVRAGSIIPTGPADAQYAAQAVAPTEVRVYPGADKTFTMYADAGDSYAYVGGAAETIPFSYSNSTATLTIGQATGTYTGMPTSRSLRVVFVGSQHGAGVGDTPTAPTVSYQGRPLDVTSTSGGANLGQTLSTPSQPIPAGGSGTVTATVLNAGPAAARKIAAHLGAIFTPAGAGATSTAAVHVDTQQNTDPWAKAGLVMRNDLTKDHQSAGYVALVVTPGNGVSLQWDADGDGIADSFRSVGAGSVQAPVWLRLSRSGKTYTGWYSMDNAAWISVGGITVESATPTQDVGMIATSHSSARPGLNTFSSFTVTS